MSRYSACPGQLTIMNFQQDKEQPGEVIKYKSKPKVYCMYVASDEKRVREFKEAFDITYITPVMDRDGLYIMNEIDYLLVFLSEESLKNRFFLELFLENSKGKDIEKIIGL